MNENRNQPEMPKTLAKMFGAFAGLLCGWPLSALVVYGLAKYNGHYDSEPFAYVVISMPLLGLGLLTSDSLWMEPHFGVGVLPLGAAILYGMMIYGWRRVGRPEAGAVCAIELKTSGGDSVRPREFADGARRKDDACDGSV